MNRWLTSGRTAAILAVVSGLLAIGHWLVFLPLLAMGTVDADRLYIALVILAFVAWPAAAVAAIAAATLVGSRPRLAALLLLLMAPGLGWPFVVLPVLPLTAAAIAYASSRATEPAVSKEPVRRTVGQVARAVAIGVVAVVGLVTVAALTVPWLIEQFLFDDGPRPPSFGRLEQSAFGTPEEALEAYGEVWEPPFVGDCPWRTPQAEAEPDEGTCIDPEFNEVSESEATYLLCALSSDSCVEVRLTRELDQWTFATDPLGE